ncbi:MAG: NADH-quinone oxidoreductase subunit N [Parachlamydiaceae bacterium]|nr:NADH-quinone oxidoreductase subunit N [Parachlamydiaceae bacterium]
MNIDLNWMDIAAISPLMIILGGALITLLIECFANHAKKYLSISTLMILLIAIFASFKAPFSENPLLKNWLKFDELGRFFTLFILLIGSAAILLSMTFFQRFEATQGEYYFFLLSAIFGLILMVLSADFLTLFLGIETLSISLYLLCGYMKTWKKSHESAIKYFLMGSIAAAFLLYGVALIYGATGTTRFDLLIEKYQENNASNFSFLFMSGIFFVTMALAFEAAIFPFQVWAPDVYEGAPTPITAFMAVGTKVGAFVAFIRVFFEALPEFSYIWSQGVACLVYPTLIYANFMAMQQTQLRRFFAYSGISHAGFLLIAVATGTQEALAALLFYLVVYALSTLGAFAVIESLDQNSEGATITDLQGLFQRSPFQGIILSICLLTLAGIPPTIGFFAKFYLFQAAFENQFYGLVIVGLLTTIISAYYYLRLIGIIFDKSTEENKELKFSPHSLILGSAAVLGVLILSVYPGPLMNFFSNAIFSDK